MLIYETAIVLYLLDYVLMPLTELPLFQGHDGPLTFPIYLTAGSFFQMQPPRHLMTLRMFLFLVSLLKDLHKQVIVQLLLMYFCLYRTVGSNPFQGGFDFQFSIHLIRLTFRFGKRLA